MPQVPEVEQLEFELKMILMGADYTGLSPKSHAWVEMPLLNRLYDFLRARRAETEADDGRE